MRLVRGLPTKVVVIVCAVTASVATRSDAQPEASVARRAQRLADQGLLRPAEAILTTALGAVDAERDDDYAEMALTLADVYLASGIPDKALTWARRASASLTSAERAPGRDDVAKICLAGEIATRALLDGGDARAAAEELSGLAAVERDLPALAPHRLGLLAARADVEAELSASRAAEAMERFERAVDDFTRSVRENTQRLSPGERMDKTLAVVDLLTRLGREAEAVGHLEWLLAEFDDAPDSGVDLVPVVDRLADIREQLGDADGERAALRSAVEMLLARPADEPEEALDVEIFLVDVHRRLAIASKDDAATVRGRLSAAAASIEAARRALESLPSERVGDYDALIGRRVAELELTKARLADQRAGGIAGALESVVDNTTRALLEADPRVALASLALAAEYVSQGEFELARIRLTPAIETLSRSPSAKRDLARAYVLLSEVRYAEGDFAGVGDCLDRAEQLIASDGAPDPGGASDEADALGAGPDPSGDFNALAIASWIEVYHGRLEAARAHYVAALARFDAADAACAADSDWSAAVRSASLLHRALVYRTLSRFDDAVAASREAVALRRESVGSDRDPRLLPYYLALGGIAAASGAEDVLEEAVRAGSEILGAQSGDARLIHLDAMRHFIAAERLAGGGDASVDDHRAEARRLWREALRLQEAGAQPVSAARSRHYLSRLDLRDGLLALQRSREAFDARRRASPDRQFDGRIAAHDEAVRLLMEEWDTYSEEYEQYKAERPDSLRFDALLERYNRLKRESADLAARRVAIQRDYDEQFERFLEERRRETGGAAKRFLDSADDLATRACADLGALAAYPRLHYAALVNHAEILRAKSEVLADPAQRAIDRLEEALALVEAPRRNVGDDAARAEFFARHASAFDLLVDWLVEDGRPREAITFADLSRNRTLLDQLRSSNQLRASDEAATGEQRSSLVDADVTQAMIGRAVDEAITVDRPLLYYYVGERRSYVFTLGFGSSGVHVERLTEKSAAGADLDVGRARVKRMVDDYASVLSSRGASRTLSRRGDVNGKLTAYTSVLLPGPVLENLRRLEAEGAPAVTIVADGALFQLPFPALITKARPIRFLLDEAPPLVVAPSLTVAQKLAEASVDTPSLLSVAMPAYTSRERLDAAPAGSAAQRYASLRGSLVALPNTKTESDRVSGMFDVTRRRQLLAEAATEAAFRAAIEARPSILHIATHGISSNETGVIDGMLAFAAPAEGAEAERANDGFLELSEVADLDLAACQLAVLSACKTSVGDVRLLEMGASFARAFLEAGAKRVVATHWEMDDASGADLIAEFFARMDPAAAGPGYARALRDAQRGLRSTAEWASPYHWAVFSLVGAPDRAAAADIVSAR